MQPGRIDTGYVAHTLGWPLGLRYVRWRLGLRPAAIIAFRWAWWLRSNITNPLFDPHEAFQKYKTHPFVKKILEGGKLVRYGAKTVPYGGWYSMPRSYVDGGLIIGDSASLLNSQRLKGIHTAIKSGMLAAETIYEALCAGDASAKTLAAYPQKIEQSWIKKELWEVRNFHQGFHGGLYSGLVHAGLQFVTGGRGLIDPMRSKPGYQEYTKLNRARAPGRSVHAIQRRRQTHLRPPHRRLSLRHAPRRRSAVPSRRARPEYLRRPLRARIRKSLPIFLSRGGLRNGHGKRRAKTENQRLQLRPLQNLRYRRPLPDHQLGPAGGRRRPQLRGNVIAVHARHACPLNSYSSKKEIQPIKSSCLPSVSEDLLDFVTSRPAKRPLQPRPKSFLLVAH